MSGAAIGPGDLVECVGDWPHVGLTRGSIWLCNAVEEIDDPELYCDLCADQSQPILFLRGWRPPTGYEGACACGFRLVRRPNADLLRSLLHPIEADNPSIREEVG